ncbi:MAG: hypothetical protein HC857_02100 [Synechococcales cyanobacterium RU_4_20]|nr:hypothetical protein [Synechococcales cyanobacterium RU_4_20]
MAQTLSPSASGAGQHLAQTGFKPGRGWPHPEIIGKITELEPNFQTTLGVLPSIPGLNQHNVSLFGNLADFRVAGRQVGTQAAEIGQDVRSLSWFLTKTGDQGSVPAAQAQMVKAVETSPEFATVGQWPLPDDSDVTLWQRRQPQFSLEAAPANTEPELRLLSVNLPANGPTRTAAPGHLSLVWLPRNLAKYSSGTHLAKATDAGAGFTITHRLWVRCDAILPLIPDHYPAISSFSPSDWPCYLTCYPTERRGNIG